MMAEELDDGEFWLPSEILTDDDILVDLDLPSSGSVTGSTGSETDEDDLLAGLPHQLTRSTISNSPLPSKGVSLSTSPQSTLCGFAANQGSSRGTPVGAVSPAKDTKEDDGATWDLLYKAAGEVARIKLRTETAGKVGTGFFDCSAKRPLCPQPTTVANYPSFQFQPLSHIRQQQLIMRASNGSQFNRTNATNNNNRPLGLPPSAWPPLQAQKQPISPTGPPMRVGQTVPPRECVGTGVFLPRRPTETRKKSESNGTKNRSGKGHNKSQQQRISVPPPANPKAIKLPQEWTY
uniref:Uncharacterized protein n=1 Tax=Opuntia streptacantha TaxID=393608 RepID=A0A7C9D719_OPUST